MSALSFAAIYFIVWWLCFFAVLPWGVRTQHDEGEVVPGTEAGAPVAPKLLAKAIWTSVIAAVVVGGFYFAVMEGWLTVDNLSLLGKPEF
ncbi:MAG: DUF1467 family protein [Flavobacteriaceae bacterium]